MDDLRRLFLLLCDKEGNVSISDLLLNAKAINKDEAMNQLLALCHLEEKNTTKINYEQFVRVFVPPPATNQPQP